MPAATTRKLDEYEKTALLAMDDAAGEYVAWLESTDLAVWSDAQRKVLWLRVMLAWEASLKEQARGGGEPF